MKPTRNLKYRYYFVTIGLAFILIAITRQSNIDAVTNIHSENYFKEIGISIWNTILCESNNLIGYILAIHLVYIVKSRQSGLKSYRLSDPKYKRIVFSIILFVTMYSLVIPLIKGSVYKLDYINSYYHSWYFYFTVLLYGFCYFIGLKVIFKYMVRYIDFDSLNDSFGLVIVLFSSRALFLLILVFSYRIFEIDKIIFL